MTLKTLLRTAVFFVFAGAIAGEWPYSFIKQIGGPGRQLINAVAVDGEGNIAIAGALEGTADFGGGPLTSAGNGDMFVAKFNARGEHLWSKRFGSRGDDTFVQVRFDSRGNLILAGDSDGPMDFGSGILSLGVDHDGYLVKFSPDGSLIWVKRIGLTGYQNVSGIALDASDDIALAGTYQGFLDFGLGALPPEGRIYLAKLTSSGTPIFSKAFSSLTGTDLQAVSVAVSPSGRIAMTGPFLGTADIGGNVLTAPAPNGFNSYIAEFAADGTPSWARAYAMITPAIAFAAGDELIVSAEIDDAQSATFGTRVFTGLGSVMARLDAAGLPRWSRFFAGDIGNALGASALTIDGAGDITWVATATGNGSIGEGPLPNNPFDYDIVLARFDSEAHLLSWSIHGDKRPQFLASVARGPAGEIVLAGSFSGAIAFGGVTLYDADGSGTSAGTDQTQEDMFLVRIAPPPRRRAARH
jgi:outer membrane protein assembly factor BamB